MKPSQIYPHNSPDSVREFMRVHTPRHRVAGFWVPKNGENYLGESPEGHLRYLVCIKGTHWDPQEKRLIIQVKTKGPSR